MTGIRWWGNLRKTYIDVSISDWTKNHPKACFKMKTLVSFMNTLWKMTSSERDMTECPNMWAPVACLPHPPLSDQWNQERAGGGDGGYALGLPTDLQSQRLHWGWLQLSTLSAGSTDRCRIPSGIAGWGSQPALWWRLFMSNFFLHECEFVSSTCSIFAKTTIMAPSMPYEVSQGTVSNQRLYSITKRLQPWTPTGGIHWSSHALSHLKELAL